MDSHTILVVEDELLVLETLKTVLQDRGYAVLTASNGDEAIQLFIDRYEEIDLVLLDMQMPGKNGGEALEEMQFIDPEVKAFFITGVLVDWESLGALGIIQKPFLTSDLVDKVDSILTAN